MARQGSLQLLVVSGPDAGEALPLDPGRHLIGTHPKCDLVLHDRTVSRQHLEASICNGAVRLRDLDSRNGSFYREVRFHDIDVGAGAIISIGHTDLKIAPARRSTALTPSPASSFGTLMGASLAMRQIYAVLECVAATETSVLILGETGTGKDLTAESIHRASKRAAGPFVACNVAALPTALAESELFGHLRGAFTGAEQARAGAFMQAQGGTLFLDEVGELDPAAQICLLRAIERHEIKPIGANRHQLVDVRVIAATSRDLEAEVKARRFRLDLYHRLAVVSVELPPLRERKEDIPALVEAFAGSRITAAPEVLAMLAAHDWPGNVRELRNVIERACALCPGGDTLRPDSIGPLLSDGPAAQPLGSTYRHSRQKVLEEWETHYLERLLRRAAGNVAEAARLGGIDRAQLHRLLRRRGLQRGVNSSRRSL